MILQRVTVRNFRNLDNVTVDFGLFNVIIGPNNSGKTNLLEAIRKVLGPGSARNVSILDSDFGDLARPIEIEICFGLETEHDLAVFYGVRGGQIDPAQRTVTVQFTAEWRQESREVYAECFITRDGLPEDYRQRAVFDWTFKRYIQFELVPAIREVPSSVDFSARSSDLRQIFSYFASDFVRPVEAILKATSAALAKVVSDTETLRELGLFDIANTIKAKFSELDHQFRERARDNRPPFSRTQIDDCRRTWKEIETTLESVTGDADSTSDGHEHQHVEDLRRVIKKVLLVIERMDFQVTLFELRESISQSSQFSGLHSRIADIASALIPGYNASLSLFPIKDNELIASAVVEMEGLPFQHQGSGHQSSFVIGLKLLRALAQLQDDTEGEINYLLLGLEEIETHLHPQMQRFVVNALKRLQQRFADEGKTIQIILTTHSPDILSRCEIENLIILGPKHRTDRVGRCSLEDLKAIALSLAGGETDGLSKKIARLRLAAEQLLLTNGDALFAQCVVVAEGASEQGAIPVFARNMADGFDLDEVGITVIDGCGAEMMYPLYLLQQLKIPSTFAYDSTDPVHKHIAEKFGGFPTDLRKFEDEILANIPIHLVLEALYEVNERRVTEMVRSLPKTGVLQGIETPESLIACLKNVKNGQIQELTRQIRTMLDREKGYMTGRRIAQKATKPEYVPAVYRRMLLDARRKAKGELDAPDFSS